MPMYVKSKGDGLNAIRDAIRFLQRNRVLIGIPEEGGGHGGVSNVELAFIHTNGSPVNRIPARPFLEPAVTEVQDEIAEKMKQAAIAAVEGDTGAAADMLHQAGQIGENAAKEYIGFGNHAPNAGITVSGGWMRNRVSGKPVYVKGKGSNTPLMDTGSLRSSITHVIDSE